jgi:hypothetical protein
MIRYAPTWVDEAGARWVLDQFLTSRSAFDTREEAQAWIDGCRADGRSCVVVDEIYGSGTVGRLEVRQVECGAHRAPLKWRAE